MPFPKNRVKAISNPACTPKCTVFPRTEETGTISRGKPTFLIRPLLSKTDVEPLSQATEKKLNGTSPVSTNKGKSSIGPPDRILRKTNVRTPIITSGFASDQNTPSDMFRYRILKSLATKIRNKKDHSPG